MTDKHYLEREFEELMTDPETMRFLDGAALDGLWYWDIEDPEHEWMSPGFWRTLGFDPKDKAHLASEWQNLIHPEDQKQALANFERHLADENHPYDQLVRYRTADEGTVTVRCRGKAIRVDGVPKRMLGAHTVVHDTRKHEVTRQLSELLELSNDAILAWSVRTGVRRWNRGAERLYGYTSQEVIGRDPREFLSPDFPGGWNGIEDCLSEGKQWEGRVAWRRADGAEVVTSSRFQRLEVSSGDALILQIDRDKTDELRRRAATNLALEAGQMGTFVWNPQTDDLVADDRDHALLAAAPGTLTRAEHFFERVHPDDKDRMSAAVDRALSSGDDYDEEFRILKPDGSERWLAVRGRVSARDAEGRPVELRGVNWDVTSRHRADERQRVLARELNHRVKNLFSIVQALVRMSAQGETDVDALARKIRNRVAALASSHMTSMSETGMRPVPLSEVLDGVLAPYGGEGDRLKINGPALTLGQEAVTPMGLILHELATNAVKYGAWSDESGQVEVTSKLVLTDPPKPVGELVWRERCLKNIGSEATRTTSFGTKLIDMSIDQLGGSIERVWHDDGLEVVLRFSIEHGGKD